MNLSFARGDKEDAVKENYRRISAALGFLPEDIVTSDQDVYKRQAKGCTGR